MPTTYFKSNSTRFSRSAKGKRILTLRSVKYPTPERLGPGMYSSRLLKNTLQRLNSGANKNSGLRMEGSLARHGALNFQWGPGLRGTEGAGSSGFAGAHATAASAA